MTDTVSALEYAQITKENYALLLVASKLLPLETPADYELHQEDQVVSSTSITNPVLAPVKSALEMWFTPLKEALAAFCNQSPGHNVTAVGHALIQGDIDIHPLSTVKFLLGTNRKPEQQELDFMGNFLNSLNALRKVGKEFMDLENPDVVSRYDNPSMLEKEQNLAHLVYSYCARKLQSRFKKTKYKLYSESLQQQVLNIHREHPDLFDKAHDFRHILLERIHDIRPNRID